MSGKWTPGPWHYGTHSGDERNDGSDWGAEGLWTKDNKLILGTGGGWDESYQGPDNPADVRLLVASPMLAETLARARQGFEMILNARERGFDINYAEGLAETAMQTIDAALAKVEWEA